MRKVIRLTEEDLKGIVDRSVQRALREGRIDVDREIRFAQKELYSMSNNLSSIGMRLEGTPFEPLYKRMRDAMVQLNNALIEEIRGAKTR